MQELELTLAETAKEIQERLEDILPVACGEASEKRLLEALRYTTLSEGKRIRPFLTLTTAQLFGVSRNSALQAAAAVEMVHAYSLVHDDLPAMDNDDMRRGQPSCHKKFDEATAILTGDALLTLAFEVLADPLTHADSNVRCELISGLAKAAGARGMVGGQMMDLFYQHRSLTMSEITRLQRMKTGALFAFSCEAGAILGKAPRNLRQALRGYAQALGLTFQITDDVLDVQGEADVAGKALRKDVPAGKPTFVAAIGIEAAKEQAHILVNQAITFLEVFDERANHLRHLAQLLLIRRK